MSRPPLHRPAAMEDADAELMDAAVALLDRVYVEGRHEVVSAMRTSDGSLQLGVHVDGSARRSAVCAEGVAAGNVFAQAAGGKIPAEVVSCIAVLRRPGGSLHVIEPCGVCAEMLSDYWPNARVWVTVGDEIVSMTTADLLPAKRRRGW